MKDESNNVVGQKIGRAHELGVLLFPSRADAEYHMGHLWIIWTRAGATESPSRGYRPDYSQIPKEFRSPSKYRDYFIANAVPGQIVNEAFRDDTVKVLKQQRNDVRETGWPIDARGLAHVELEGFIPHGHYVFTKGKYSCDLKREDCDNCSSWGLKVVRGAMHDPGFLPCERPKRLRDVEHAIWGD